MLELQPSDRRPGAPSSSGDGGGDEMIRTYKGWKGNNVSFSLFISLLSWSADLRTLTKI